MFKHLWVECGMLSGSTDYCKSSKSLEGNRGKDRVRRCRLSTSFLQEGSSVNVCG